MVFVDVQVAEFLCFGCVFEEFNCFGLILSEFYFCGSVEEDAGEADFLELFSVFCWKGGGE